MRFEGLRDTIGDALLFRGSDEPTCASFSRCWYVLLPSEQAEPLVTPCDFVEGSLAHHFNPDRSNFFVFDFLCSKTPMQIQVSNGQSKILVGK